MVYCVNDRVLDEVQSRHLFNERPIVSPTGVEQLMPTQWTAIAITAIGTGAEPRFEAPLPEDMSAGQPKGFFGRIMFVAAG